MEGVKGAELKVIVLYIILYASIFIAVFSSIRFITRRNVLEKVLLSFENKSKKDKEAQERIRSEYGNIEQKGIYNDINSMFQRSQIDEKIPFMTTELYLVISIFLSVCGYFLSKIISSFWAINLLVALAILLVMYFIIYYLSGRVYEQIDNQINSFINYLDNFSTNSSDIISIIEDTTRYMNGVLRKYLLVFIVEAKQGNIKLAFTNLENKLENQKFRQFIKNLEIASRHEANYKEVINEARMIFKGYFKNKAKRGEVIKNGRVEIIILIALSTFIFKILQTVTPNLVTDLTTSNVGSIFILALIFLVAATVLVFIKIDRG